MQRHGRWLSRMARGLVALTAFIIIIPTALGAVLASRYGLPLGTILLRAAIIWAPGLCYLYAVWALGGAFREVGKGALFGSAVATGCTRAGAALAIGAVLSALFVPTALRLLHARGLFGAEGEGWANLISLDLAYLAVGVVGITLLMLGRLFRHAATVQQRASALEEELGGFF